MVRTCVACRRACEVGSDLIRVVLVAGVVTPSKSSQGRGAWLHIGCARQAIARQSFRSTFKSNEKFDTQELEKLLNELDAKDMTQK